MLRRLRNDKGDASMQLKELPPWGVRVVPECLPIRRNVTTFVRDDTAGARALSAEPLETMKLDDALTVLGAFGRYQMFVFIVVSVFDNFPSIMHMSIMAFIGFEPRHRCEVLAGRRFGNCILPWFNILLQLLGTSIPVPSGSNPSRESLDLSLQTASIVKSLIR